MNDLDGILKELGQFGKYQIFTYFLLFFPLIFAAIGSMTYVFTTGDLQYRCLVPECEGSDSMKYDQPWLQNAIPYSHNVPGEHCLRFKPKSNFTEKNCSKDNFLSDTEVCNKFVFENDENTITKEFGLLCEENNWKRTIIGTLNNIAQFIAMPIAGVVSDRFGRKTMLVGSLTLSALFGTIRSFTTSYTQFVIFEMLDAMAYSGVYSGIFIFGVEIIGPDKRGVGGAIISVYYSIGEIILGIVVWLVHDWRQYLRILYIPGFIFILYLWILPESIRWLVAHGKREKVIEVFKRMCKLNKRNLDDGLKKAIENLFSSDPIEIKEETPIKEEKSKYPLAEVMRSKIMLLRVLNCAFCWITHTFVFYGLSLNSVSIAGNKYLNFILVSFVEIPAYALSWVMVGKLGRKLSLFLGLAVSGVACTAFYFVSPDAYVLRLILFLTGKLAITESFTTLYVLASEIYPTDLRHSLLGFCSTLGRIGSMVAPQTPLMAKYVDPVLAFGGISFLAALLGLYFPETKNCTLPDTLQDAENLGKKRKDDNSSKETLSP